MGYPNELANNRILVIDDNEEIHQDISSILNQPKANSGFDLLKKELFGERESIAENKRFQIDSAFQGKEGLYRVTESVKANKPYAMAFVDMRMPPGWDGLETLERLWRVDEELEAVICTAYADYSWEDIVVRFKDKAEHLLILKKPFDSIEIRQVSLNLTTKWSLKKQSKMKQEELEELVAARTQKLQLAEKRYRTIFDTMTEGVVLFDSDGRIVQANPSAAEMLDLNPSELEKEGFSEPDWKIVRPDSTSMPLAEMATQRAIKEQCLIKDVLMGVQRQDDHVTWLSTSAAPILTEDGRSDGVVGTFVDTTERRQIETKLLHAQKMESIGQLAAGIAHEINTPIQFIGDNTRFLQGTFADVLGLLQIYNEFQKSAEAGQLTPEQKKEVTAAREDADLDFLTEEIPLAIEQSLDGVSRISEIVLAMKEFSHPDSKEKTQIDINSAIISTITVARNEWKYVAEMEKNLADDLPPIPCLPGEINQVMLNIIVNAAHAIGDKIAGTDQRGVITVSTRQVGDFAEISIRDDGLGIPEKAQARIFDPFFTTKRVGKGTGQGLAIAHSVVVDKHGGEIEFETESGQGTTFFIRLPITNGQSSG